MKLKRKLINFLAAPILAAVLIISPIVANATCTIYQHRDYGGASYTLYDRDRLIMVDGEELDYSRGRGLPRTFYNASWNDHVSSFKVTEGCEITLYEHINRGGARWVSSQSYVFVGSRWNDKVSEVYCSCP